MTFEVPSFTDSKDTIGGQNLKDGSHDPDHTHCHLKASTRYILPAYKIWQLASAIAEMFAGIKIANRLCDPDHTPFRGSLSSIS